MSETADAPLPHLRDGAPRFLSGARLDVTTLVAPARAADLRAGLADAALSLVPVPGFPRGRHPLIFDLFDVRNGRLEAGGLDQRGWASAAATAGSTLGSAAGAAFGTTYGALAGATMGGYMGGWFGPAAWLWAAGVGWMAGGVLGGAAAVLPGARLGRALGDRSGAAFGHGLAEALGNYREIVVGVPNVRVKGLGPTLHLAVLALFTDSRVAKMGDEWLGFGYGKRMATIAAHPFRSFVVRPEGDASGGPSFVAALSPPAAKDWRAPDAVPGLAGLITLLAQPLLGRLPGGGLARSHLERAWDRTQVRCAPCPAARVTVRPGFAAGVAAGTFRLRNARGKSGWAAYHVAGLPSRVSWPERLPFGPKGRRA